MSFNRKNKILELIQNHEVETQQQLVELLAEEGFKATQATVSRDIKEMKLIKTASQNGKSIYTLAPKNETKLSDRFIKILKETIKSVKASGNLIVIQTLNGCANAACEAIDSASSDEIIGSLAGDNTLLLIIDSPDNVDMIVRKIKDIIA